MVTHRDKQVLKDLGRFQLLTTNQCRRLHFSHIEPCRRRLRALLDLDPVQRHPRPSVSLGRPELVYQLTSAGWRFIGQQSRPYRGNFSYLFLDHSLAVTDAIISINNDASVLKYSCGYLTEPELKSVTSNSDIVPDALVTLRNSAGKRTLLYLEIDRDTQTLVGKGKTISRKLSAYCSALQSSTFFKPDT